MDAVSQGLSTGLAAAAAVIATTYLRRSTRPAARQEGSARVVEYGRTMKVITVVLWLLPAGVAVSAAFAAPSERMLAFSVAGVSLLSVLSLHLEFFHVLIRYDADGLHLTSPWRRNRFIPWTAITGARFSPTLQWYVLSTKGYGHIRLHLYLSGLRSLLDELAARGIFIPAATPLRK